MDSRHPVRRGSESKMWMETTVSWEAVVGLVDPCFYVADAIVLFWVLLACLFYFIYFFKRDAVFSPILTDWTVPRSISCAAPLLSLPLNCLNFTKHTSGLIPAGPRCELGVNRELRLLPVAAQMQLPTFGENFAVWTLREALFPCLCTSTGAIVVFVFEMK